MWRYRQHGDATVGHQPGEHAWVAMEAGGVSSSRAPEMSGANSAPTAASELNDVLCSTVSPALNGTALLYPPQVVDRRPGG